MWDDALKRSILAAIMLNCKVMVMTVQMHNLEQWTDPQILLLSRLLKLKSVLLVDVACVHICLNV